MDDPSNLTRADILESTAIDDFVEAEDTYSDSYEEFGIHEFDDFGEDGEDDDFGGDDDGEGDGGGDDEFGFSLFGPARRMRRSGYRATGMQSMGRAGRFLRRGRRRRRGMPTAGMPTAGMPSGMQGYE